MIRWAISQTNRVCGWFAQVAAKARQPLWADQRIKVAYTEREPTKPKARRLYVATSSRGPNFGYLLCPCGCGETLHLRFLPDRYPRWDLDIEVDGVASIRPSVWRQVGCRSHFVLTRGNVHWC